MTIVDTPHFSDITTMGVGGKIAQFVEPVSRAQFLEALIDADAAGRKLCVIGGGSNMLVSDEDFDGIVIRDARKEISILDEATPLESHDSHTAMVSATAGVHWDDFVAYCVRMGLAGVEALSGIPGTVGASVVQNIGAYGQEVGTSVHSVEVWDREEKTVRVLDRQELAFGYRTSLLKQSMYVGQSHSSHTKYFPSPRYIVLEVTFVLEHSDTSQVNIGQLARALGVEVGQRYEVKQIRDAVLEIRKAKGMVEDQHRYENPWMRGTANVDAAAIETPSDRDNWSCGSFFMNPVITKEQAKLLPEDAPRFAGVLPDGDEGVKTSAAWLIDHAGFKVGYKVNESAHAGLSTKHTLALTNRGDAKTADLIELARTIRAGVLKAYNIELVPEPVFIGVEL